MELKETKDSNQSVRARGMSRRSVLAAGLAAPMVVSRHILGGSAYQAPSKTLAIAAVGVGGVGGHYLSGCKGERVVGLCDLDHNRSAKVFETYPSATRYHDFRKMFDKEVKNIDAVIIGTPDHTHALVLMSALQLEKHVYCAKPITHTIGEGRKVRAAFAAAKKLVTKSSVQSSGTKSARSTTELLNSGVIGPVREVHVWIDHPVYPTGLLRPTEIQTPPPGMDWDLWIGPAPYRPYNSAYHPVNWRAWWDFGAGTVGDMCCHTLHLFFRELQLYAPATVYGYGSKRHDGFFKHVITPECESRSNMVTWEFPARGALPPLNLYWYDGGMKPHRPAELDHAIEMPPRGVLFVGDEGKLLSGFYGGNSWYMGAETKPLVLGIDGGLLLPQKKFKDYQQPEATLPRVKNHYLEWTETCKTGGRTEVPIEYGCDMTELGLLGALALRTGRVLEWDAQTTQITNDREANSLLDPPYREGWKL